MLRHGQIWEKRISRDILISKADEKRLPQGHYQVRTHNQLVAMSWFARRGVYLLSSIHSPRNPDGTLPTVPRKNGREQVDVPCPPAQVDYQKYMGGVGLLDQLTKTFFSGQKIKESLEEAFRVWARVCLLDSFIIMGKANPQSSQEFIDFRLAVARQLIVQTSFRHKAGRPPSLPLSETDEKRLNDKRRVLEVTGIRRDCAVCAKKAIMEDLGENYRYKSYIVYVRRYCIPLCINKDRNFWEKWHTSCVYWQ